MVDLGPTSPAPDATGTFYCQAGDHIVDSVVWLETITLGCRPCMEKLGKSISTDTWTPRLWSVGADGIRRAADIPRPELEKPEPPKPNPRKGNNPFSDPVGRSPRRGSPRQYVKEHQDWTCTVCHRTDDTMNGYYNTVLGYTCKRCTPRRPGSDQSYFEHRERFDRIRFEHERRIKEAQRRSEEAERRIEQAQRQIEAAERQHREEAHRREIESFIEKATTINRSGTGEYLDLPTVLPGQRVTLSGTGTKIKINGDVGEAASVTIRGTGSAIVIKGHIHQDATVDAEGTGCSITYRTRDIRSQVQAHGTGASVKGKVLGGSTTRAQDADPSTERARQALAQTYHLEYPDVPSTWATAKAKMADDVAFLGQRMFECFCVRCGKRERVLGGDAESHSRYKCNDCVKATRPWPEFRDAQFSMIPNLQTVRSRYSLPRKGATGDWRYAIDGDQLFTWMDGQRDGAGWVQVALPSAKRDSHQHVWRDQPNMNRSICYQCGFVR